MLAFAAGFLVVAAVVGVLLSLHGSPPPHKRLHRSSSHHAVHHTPRTSKPPSQPQTSRTKTSPSTPGVSELRFADSRDGFAYGPSLFVTHNAGQSWEQVHVGAAVTNIAISSTDVYALVASSGGAGKLVRSPTGANDWVPLSVSVSAYGGLSVHGSDVFAQSGPKLLVSHDGGGTFSSYPAPSDLPCDFEEPVRPVVWTHCATGTESSTWRSTDGGRRFTAPGPGSGGAGIAPEPNSAVFAAASDTTAVIPARLPDGLR